MQTSVPDLMDISKESKATLEAYGAEPRQGVLRQQLPARAAAGGARRALHPAVPPRLGSARRSAEGHPRSRRRTPTRPARRWWLDLKQRGLLDDTLVIWGGEFGRTSYSQGDDQEGQLRARPSSALLLTVDGWRRHQARASPTVRQTTSPTTSRRTPVHVHDFHATMMHLLGIDHTRLTYRFEGRDYRLTDIAGELVKGILA